MLYNETLDIILSSDNNKTSSSCIVFIVLFSSPHYFRCLNINGYYTTKY